MNHVGDQEQQGNSLVDGDNSKNNSGKTTTRALRRELNEGSLVQHRTKRGLNSLVLAANGDTTAPLKRKKNTTTTTASAATGAAAIMGRFGRCFAPFRARKAMCRVWSLHLDRKLHETTTSNRHLVLLFQRILMFLLLLRLQVWSDPSSSHTAHGFFIDGGTSVTSYASVTTRIAFDIFTIYPKFHNNNNNNNDVACGLSQAEEFRAVSEDCIRFYVSDGCFMDPVYIGLGGTHCTDNNLDDNDPNNDDNEFAVTILGGVFDFAGYNPPTVDQLNVCVQDAMESSICLLMFQTSFPDVQDIQYVLFSTPDPTMSPTNPRPTHLPSTNFPTHQPTFAPSTQIPTRKPTFKPSMPASTSPSIGPTQHPSFDPTPDPTTKPSAIPSLLPTFQRSGTPSQHPTMFPSSSQPSSSPTATQSLPPTVPPTSKPSFLFSQSPTLSPRPTQRPSVGPSPGPFAEPSSVSSTMPTSQPSLPTSLLPSVQISTTPSFSPSKLMNLATGQQNPNPPSTVVFPGKPTLLPTTPSSEGDKNETVGEGEGDNIEQLINDDITGGNDADDGEFDPSNPDNREFVPSPRRRNFVVAVAGGLALFLLMAVIASKRNNDRQRKKKRRMKRKYLVNANGVIDITEHEHNVHHDEEADDNQLLQVGEIPSTGPTIPMPPRTHGILRPQRRWRRKNNYNNNGSSIGSSSYMGSGATTSSSSHHGPSSSSSTDMGPVYEDERDDTSDIETIPHDANLRVVGCSTTITSSTGMLPAVMGAVGGALQPPPGPTGSAIAISTPGTATIGEEETLLFNLPHTLLQPLEEKDSIMKIDGGAVAGGISRFEPTTDSNGGDDIDEAPSPFLDLSALQVNNSGVANARNNGGRNRNNNVIDDDDGGSVVGDVGGPSRIESFFRMRHPSSIRMGGGTTTPNIMESLTYDNETAFDDAVFESQSNKFALMMMTHTTKQQKQPGVPVPPSPTTSTTLKRRAEREQMWGETITHDHVLDMVSSDGNSSRDDIDVEIPFTHSSSDASNNSTDNSKSSNATSGIISVVSTDASASSSSSDENLRAYHRLGMDRHHHQMPNVNQQQQNETLQQQQHGLLPPLSPPSSTMSNRMMMMRQRRRITDHAIVKANSNTNDELSAVLEKWVDQVVETPASLLGEETTTLSNTNSDDDHHLYGDQWSTKSNSNSNHHRDDDNIMEEVNKNKNNNGVGGDLEESHREEYASTDFEQSHWDPDEVSDSDFGSRNPEVIAAILAANDEQQRRKQKQKKYQRGGDGDSGVFDVGEINTTSDQEGGDDDIIDDGFSHWSTPSSSGGGSHLLSDFRRQSNENWSRPSMYYSETISNSGVTSSGGGVRPGLQEEEEREGGGEQQPQQQHRQQQQQSPDRDYGLRNHHDLQSQQTVPASLSYESELLSQYRRQSKDDDLVDPRPRFRPRRQQRSNHHYQEQSEEDVIEILRHHVQSLQQPSVSTSSSSSKHHYHHRQQQCSTDYRRRRRYYHKEEEEKDKDKVEEERYEQEHIQALDRNPSDDAVLMDNDLQQQQQRPDSPTSSRRQGGRQHQRHRRSGGHHHDRDGTNQINTTTMIL